MRQRALTAASCHNAAVRRSKFYAYVLNTTINAWKNLGSIFDVSTIKSFDQMTLVNGGRY